MKRDWRVSDFTGLGVTWGGGVFAPRGTNTDVGPVELCAGGTLKNKGGICRCCRMVPAPFGQQVEWCDGDHPGMCQGPDTTPADNCVTTTQTIGGVQYEITRCYTKGSVIPLTTITSPTRF
jgi:hypothetical protein